MIDVTCQAHPGQVRLAIRQLPLVDGVGTTVEEASIDLVDEFARYVSAYLDDPDGYFVRGGASNELPVVLAAQDALDEGRLFTFVFGTHA